MSEVFSVWSIFFSATTSSQEEMPQLKALIILKSKHPEFKLEDLKPSVLFLSDKEIFDILYRDNTS